jgi:hypothetical protein
VDLQTARLNPGLRVGLFEQAPSRLVDGCVSAWRARGVDVTPLGFGGLEPMLQQTVHGDVPIVDLSRVIGWVSETAPSTPLPIAPMQLIGREGLQPPCYTEVPLCFGEGQRLFGILCRPRQPVGDYAVLIGNTGRDPHYGVARFGVEFARLLAAQGIASFRIDFAGLGDSIGPAGQEDALGALFETDRSADISAALDVLQSLGYRHFAAHGLCSGAYHAFHGAVADTRIDALMLVNFPQFFWQNGETVEAAARKLTRPSDYLAKLVSRDTWSRVLRNQVDYGAILRSQAARLGGKLRALSLRLAEQSGSGEALSPPRRAMAGLARRQAKTLFLFSPVDPGLDAVEQAFGRNGVDLPAFGAALRVMHGWDHLLSGRHMRRTCAALMIDFLASSAQWPVSQPGGAP